MSMRKLTIAALALCGSALAGPAMALTVHTASFISSPTATVGFEGLGPISTPNHVKSYSENGVLVDYIGTGYIWSSSQAAPEGQYSWYPDGGGYGYTRFTFAQANAFELLVNSGFFDGSGVLAYDVLLGGVSVGTGIAGPAPAYGAGWATYGFSGATFDEVRLQVSQGGQAFAPTVFEAGAFDAVKIGTVEVPAVPEPATWALMITGFGAVGAMVRRSARRTRVQFA
ncbi:hypothetical protein SLG_09350 [Sphingobium sp. SYK-6]|nr:hypothetical protein SLG_09350 [Sphingobium sp. SYK-6]